MLLLQLAIGTIMMALNVMIHAFGFDRIMHHLNTLIPKFGSLFRTQWKTAAIVWSTLAAFLILIIDVWIWAIVYLCIGALDELEPALYFSLTSFTTLGIGDIILDANWRILSGIQSAIGFFLFGWTTAFIFEIISKIYRDEMRD